VSDNVLNLSGERQRMTKMTELIIIAGSPDYIHVKGCIPRDMSLRENLSHPLDWSHIQYTIFCTYATGYRIALFSLVPVLQDRQVDM
jgi:hypothetical protein